MGGVLKRVLVGLFAPAPVAIALLFGYALVQSLSLPKLFVVEAFLLWSGFAYIFIGAQSFVYTLFMEFIVNRNLENSYLAVAVSGVLGGLAGSVRLSGTILIEGLSILGVFVGLIVGTWLRSIYLQSANKAIKNDNA